MKKLSFILFFLFFFLLSFPLLQGTYVSAQTFHCFWDDSAGCVSAGYESCTAIGVPDSAERSEAFCLKYPLYNPDDGTNCSDYAYNTCSDLLNNPPPNDIYVCGYGNPDATCIAESSCGSGLVEVSGTCVDSSSLCCGPEGETPPLEPPEQCYKCWPVGSTYSCIVDTDEVCDYDSYDSCTDCCINNICPNLKYMCDRSTGTPRCLKAESGYDSLTECDENCNVNVLHPELCGDNISIDTAIGCIPVGGENGTREFVNFLLVRGVGIAGGIAFILIVAAGIMYITSGGDPKRVQAAKELLTAAVSGLLLLIFGVFILEFIGVDILNIPGFGQ